MLLEFVWLIILLLYFGGFLFYMHIYIVLTYTGSRFNISLCFYAAISWGYRTESNLIRIHICTCAVYIIILCLFVLLCSVTSTVLPPSRNANLGRLMVIIGVCKASVLDLARETCPL